MPKYRKKPAVIDAVRFDGTVESANRILSWIGICGHHATRAHSTKPEAGLMITTLEGDHLAAVGDYVIRGVAGEFYPCKPNIFEQTYEPA